jgi:hypothetical protein
LRYRHLFYFFCRLLLLRYDPDQTYIQSLRASSIASPAWMCVNFQFHAYSLMINEILLLMKVLLINTRKELKS